jgi:hypothetical protein
MAISERTDKLELVYALLCEDVRLEIDNKFSLIGVIQNILVQQLPFLFFKFAVVNHWRGEGIYLSEVRILTPDKKQPVVVSQPSRFEIPPGGYANNISFFANVTFTAPGDYWVQTLIDSTLFDEQPLMVADARSVQGAAPASEAIN